MAHRSARLTVGGRLLLIERIVVEGWSVAQAIHARVMAGSKPRALGA